MREVSDERVSMNFSCETMIAEIAAQTGCETPSHAAAS